MPQSVHLRPFVGVNFPKGWIVFNDDPESCEAPAQGWFKAVRSPDADELIQANPLAFILAYIIARRARWHGGFNRHGLEAGEAMLGDFENYGMTEKQYRTAKNLLEKGKFAAFKRANKGTIAKLIDARLFSILETPQGGRKGEQGADERANKGRETNNDKNEEGKERLNDAKPASKHKVTQRPDNSPLSAHRISAGNEKELMRRLRILLGNDEMARAGGNWRVAWVRPFPNLVESALNDLDTQIKEGKTIHNRAAWLVDLLKRFKAKT